MKVDAHIAYATLSDVPALVREAERLGLDGLWFNETSHDPFLGAALALEHSGRLTVGTSVAVAFNRSPTVLAQQAWDLAAFSRGRFTLGLGTQVKAHIVRRFGMSWETPAPRLTDYIGAIRAVWRTWGTGAPLNYQGRFYRLNLMTPFFSPPRHDHPIPIMTAGVNPIMCRVAGHAADGFHVHPFHTPTYLRNVVLPAIRRGQAKAGRSGVPFEIMVGAFAVSGEGPEEVARAKAEARRGIAFYASTPSYRGVLAHHGWQEIGERLSALAARGAWAEMPNLIPDEMLEAIAVIAPPEEVGIRIRERYTGLVTRVGFYEPFTPAAARRWTALLRAVRE